VTEIFAEIYRKKIFYGGIVIIYDEKNNTALSSISLFLTGEEAKELHDILEGLDPSIGDHLHVSDKEFKKEIDEILSDLDLLEKKNELA
jgi:hypothetical protein